MPRTVVSHRGRNDSSVIKMIVLLTARDPPDWDLTMELARKAKGLGFSIAVFTRREDQVDAENFRKLSSGGMLWFGDESKHLDEMHKLTDAGSLCKAMTAPKPVCTI